MQIITAEAFCDQWTCWIWSFRIEVLYCTSNVCSTRLWRQKMEGSSCLLLPRCRLVLSPPRSQQKISVRPSGDSTSRPDSNAAEKILWINWVVIALLLASKEKKRTMAGCFRFQSWDQSWVSSLPDFSSSQLKGEEEVETHQSSKVFDELADMHVWIISTYQTPCTKESEHWQSEEGAYVLLDETLCSTAPKLPGHEVFTPWN